MTITLYHAGDSGWTRTMLPDVWARWNRGVSHSGGYSRNDAAQSLLLVPFRVDISIAPGDAVLPGEGPEIPAGPVKASLPEAQLVTEVILHRPGSPLDHWELKAR